MKITIIFIKVILILIIIIFMLSCTGYYSHLQNSGVNYAEEVIVYMAGITVIRYTNRTYRYDDGDLIIAGHRYRD